MEASRHGAYREIDFLVENDLIKALLDVMALKPSADILFDAIEILENVLSSGNDYGVSNGIPNPYLMTVEKLGGVKLIEELQRYQDPKVYEKIAKFIDVFFDY